MVQPPKAPIREAYLQFRRRQKETQAWGREQLGLLDADSMAEIKRKALAYIRGVKAKVGNDGRPQSFPGPDRADGVVPGGLEYDQRVNALKKQETERLEAAQEAMARPYNASDFR